MKWINMCESAKVLQACYNIKRLICSWPCALYQRLKFIQVIFFGKQEFFGCSMQQLLNYSCYQRLQKSVSLGMTQNIIQAAEEYNTQKMYISVIKAEKKLYFPANKLFLSRLHLDLHGSRRYHFHISMGIFSFWFKWITFCSYVCLVTIQY